MRRIQEGGGLLLFVGEGEGGRMVESGVLAGGGHTMGKEDYVVKVIIRSASTIKRKF